MLSFDILISFFISFIIGILFYKISIPFLKKNIISNPNLRSSHLIPKANGGGIIFVTLFLIVSFCLKVYWPLSLLPLAIIGFFDDIKSQSQKLRFAVQATTSIYLNLLFLNKILILGNSLFYLFLISLFLIFLSIAIINFVNFMDGIDGLVTSNILCLLIMKFYFGDSSIIYLIGFLSSCEITFPAKDNTTNSESLFERPIMLVGRTALSEEIKTNFLIFKSNATLHIIFVEIKLLEIPCKQFFCTRETCLYAAA